MPSVSKAQRRLFGMTYCYKKGECKLSDFPESVREKVKKLAKSMTLKQLRDFAKTPEKKLPRRKKR